MRNEFLFSQLQEVMENGKVEEARRLKEMAHIALVTKLRAILLMKADFNFHNHLIFGSRMMDLARQHNMFQKRSSAKKGRTTEDAILKQILVYV